MVVSIILATFCILWGLINFDGGIEGTLHGLSAVLAGLIFVLPGIAFLCAARVFFLAPARVQDESPPVVYRLAMKLSPVVAVGGISMLLYSIEPFSMIAFLCFAACVLIVRLAK